MLMILIIRQVRLSVSSIGRLFRSSLESLTSIVVVCLRLSRSIHLSLEAQTVLVLPWRLILGA